MGKLADLPVYVSDDEIDRLLGLALSGELGGDAGEVLDDISELLDRKTEVYKDFSPEQYAAIESWLQKNWRDGDLNFFELAAGFVVGGHMTTLLARLQEAQSSPDEAVREIANEMLGEWKARYG